MAKTLQVMGWILKIEPPDYNNPQSVSKAFFLNYKSFILQLIIVRLYS